MISFGTMTVEEFQTLRDIVIAARCHLQYGRGIDKSLSIEEIERIERALVRVVSPSPDSIGRSKLVLEEVQTREGIQLCPRIS
jgi:hypothetical protein